MSEIIELNDRQTSIEDLLLDSYPEEIQDQFWEIFNSVPLVRTLTDKNRPKAKDLPKDSDGKIVIDVTKPHILEDMDYFRPTAIHYQKTGKFTDLKPTGNKNSDYYKWMMEEVNRCWNGYKRESDGEWITGDYYFFLNYCPILQSNTGATAKGKKKASRILDFPKVWEGHYLVTHYLNQARQQGHHAAELSSRGRGKSYLGAALLAKRFVLGESKEVNKEVQCVVTASERKFISGANQLLDMFKKYIDFLAVSTEFPSKKLVNSLQSLQWTMGYKDLDTDANRGTLNSVIGITSKDDEEKLRGSRGVLYLIEEAGTFPRLLSLYSNIRPSVEDGDNVFGLIFAYGCVCAGTKVWTNDGRCINIEKLHKEDGIVGYEEDLPVKNTIGTLLEPKMKPCIRITWEDGKFLECSTDHPILRQIVHTYRINGVEQRTGAHEEVWTRAEDLKIGDKIIEARYIGAFGTSTINDARLIGMLIGDGTYGSNNTPKFSSEDEELLNYVKKKYDWSISAEHITRNGKYYQDIRVKGICSLLRKIGIYGQTKTAKRLPTNYQTLTEKDTKLLLAGLYDTNGCITGIGDKATISLTQATKEILEQVALLLRKFGILACIFQNKPSIKKGRKDKNPWYVLQIKGRTNIDFFYKNIPLMQKHKIKKLNEVQQWFVDHPLTKVKCYNDEKIIIRTVKNIESIGNQIIYNLSAEQSHTYLANNIVTHNTAGDDSSDFASLQEIMYNPKGYNMLSLTNVYDKGGQGRPVFTFFFPGYMNMANCYDSNGNSDVTKALLSILQDRYTVKYNSSDINAITKRIAEIPITPQEAIIRSTNCFFPVTELNERLNQIDNNPRFYDDIAVGTLVEKQGEVVFVPTTDLPVREFPLKDNKHIGALEIYRMPEKDSSGKPTFGRYIIGHDPVDDDESNTVSLTSTFVFDLFTDQIVAEYTGRLPLANDNFEMVRKLCLFYNAKCLYEANKKGIYAYFEMNHCSHLLADTPQYLKEKNIVSSIGIGNKAKGVGASAPVNNYANRLIREWLLKPVPIQKKAEITDENGTKSEQIIETNTFNLYNLWGRGLLKELLLFNANGNFDRVRALGMVMLYREEYLILYGNDAKNIISSFDNKDGNLSEDPFFSSLYDIYFPT